MILLIYFFSCASVGAEPMHGIAMHGSPKYNSNFKNLDYVNVNAPKGGELRLGATGSFDSLNSFIIKGRAAAGRHYVFESLLARVWDEPFSLYGLIAETVEVPEDRSWVSFVLRPEARFHDNNPIRVEDVFFSWETLKKYGRANMRLFYGKVDRVETFGSRGIKFFFKADQLDRELPLIIGLMPILSKNYYKDRVFEKTTLEPPLGSGPYKVYKVQVGRNITYKKVGNYWGSSLPIRVGHNNFDIISYEYFRDTEVMMEAFKAGEYDLRREWSASRWKNNYNFDAVNAGKILLEELPNQRPAGMKAFVFNVRRKIFSEIAVRLAINQAFDFEWINKNLLHNSYKRTNSFFANSDMASFGLPSKQELELLNPLKQIISPDIFIKPYKLPASTNSGGLRKNLMLANKILEDAGWKINNGVRSKVDPNGKLLELKFEILLINPDNERIALSFVKNLKKIGVVANIRTVDSAQYQSRRQNFDFDMIIHRWRVTLSPGNEQNYYWGSEASSKKGTRNYIGIKNIAVDKLIDYVVKTSNRENLVTGMRALDRVLLNEHYVVPLYYIEKDKVAYWNKFKHPSKTPIYGFVLETWWQEKNNR